MKSSTIMQLDRRTARPADTNDVATPDPHGLTVQSVDKSFGALRVLSDIDFAVTPGSVTAVLGPSGCGKSTLLHICAGLIPPDTGEVWLKGERITGRPGQMSYLQQKDLLLPWRRIIDNVALPLELRGFSRKEARRRAAPHFQRFGIDGFERHFPFQLSGGMRQRAALLRTYLFSGSLMLLDEPFGALDTITRTSMHEWLLALLRDLRPGVLLVTHDVDEALLLSDEILVLSQRPARIVQSVPVDLPRPRGEQTLLSEEFRRTKANVLSALHRGEAPIA